MNSVSIPSRPPWRASSASSETISGETVVEIARDPTPLVASVARMRTHGGPVRIAARRLVVRGRRLVGPVAVARVELACLVLLVALAVAGHPDPEQQVEQEDGQAGADDVRRALEAVDGRVERPCDQAAEHDERGQPPADEGQPAHAAARTVGSVGSAEASNAASASSSSPGSPTERRSEARTSAGVSPSARRSSSVTAPWRLARRAPSAPSISGTWAYVGAGAPSRRASSSWRGVVSSRSAPRTTSPTPCAASSTTTARL